MKDAGEQGRRMGCRQGLSGGLIPSWSDEADWKLVMAGVGPLLSNAAEGVAGGG